MIGSWALFPLALIALALGCALLLERLARVRIPGALLIPAGIATVILVGHFTTATDATAELTAPLIAVLAVAGFVLSARWRSDRPNPWIAVAAIAVFAVYGAPVLLSGEATFAGYIRLDDTATWLALTDRVMEHGHSLEGLAPSTYEATLALNLGDGYPVGAFIPLGLGHVLTGIDSAWLIQPYMSVIAASVALCLWEILEPLVPGRPLRAAAAAIGAQPALLVGYAQWGGVKEVVAAALVALSFALAPRVADIRPQGGWIAVLGIAVAALLAALGLGGAVWVLPALVIVAALLVGRVAHRVVVGRAVALTAVVAALSLPLLLSAVLDGRLLPPTSSPLTSEAARGNLLEPLGLERLFGIWPAGDFRLDAVDGAATAVLIVLVAGAALAGLWYALRFAALGLALYGVGVLGACLLLVAVGSPWVDGKAMAIAAPALLVLAAGGASAAISRGRRLQGGIALTAITIGVLWSNGLAYRDANLAPRDQLAELEEIGEEIAGEGPALMTEYQPYGARHFLRDADPEAVSELRRRSVRLRSGETVEKGHWADTDELALDGLGVYRTLVLRRSPIQSRPPGPYGLTFVGDYYEVWQRRAGPPPRIAKHLSLGGALDPIGRAGCARVRRLSRLAGDAGTVSFAGGRSRVVVPATEMSHPDAWESGGEGTLVPSGDGRATVTVRVPDRGVWRVWVQGSIKGRLEVRLDGDSAGSARHLLNNSGLFIELGPAALGAGKHLLELDYDHNDLLHPGSGGRAPRIGPLVLTPTEPADRGVRLRDPGDATELCGRRLDWIEVGP